MFLKRVNRSIKRALEQPAEVRNALNFAKENGIMKTIARIRGTLEGGKPTGYSISGIVIAVGAGVKNIRSEITLQLQEQALLIMQNLSTFLKIWLCQCLKAWTLNSHQR